MRNSAFVVITSFLLMACGSPPSTAMPATTTAKQNVVLPAAPPPAPPTDPAGLVVVSRPQGTCELVGQTDDLDLAARPNGPALVHVRPRTTNLTIGTGGELFVQATSPLLTARGFVATGPTLDHARVHAAKWLSFGGVYFPRITDALDVSTHDGKISVAAPKDLGVTFAQGSGVLDVACDDIALDPDPNNVLRRQTPVQFPTAAGKLVALRHDLRSLALAATVAGPTVATIDDAPLTLTLVERQGKRARIRWGHFTGWIDASAIASSAAKPKLDESGFGMIGLIGGGTSMLDNLRKPARVVTCPRDVRVVVSSTAAPDERFVMGVIPAGKPVYLRASGGELTGLVFDDGEAFAPPITAATGASLSAPNVDLEHCSVFYRAPAARHRDDPTNARDGSDLTDAIDALSPSAATNTISARDFADLGSASGVSNVGGLGAGQIVGQGPSRPAPPSIRQGAASVTGNVPSDQVLRLLRDNLARFRYCYANGLRSDPTLAGRVVTAFTIDKTGKATGVVDSGSTLTEPGVRSCIEKAISRIPFPAPKSGDVKVVYPLILAPQ